MRQQWSIELKDLFRTLDEWDDARRALELAKSHGYCFLILLMAACCHTGDWGPIPDGWINGAFALLSFANAYFAGWSYRVWRRARVKSIHDVLVRLEECAQEMKQD